jgi:hypothetical protein
MGLRVLITNLGLWPPSGTSLYVRDLALELQRQGHNPMVFSSTVGEIAAELRGAGVEVTDHLDDIRSTPDVIHGHHHAPTVAAVRHWPAVPAIYVCHDHTSRYDKPPILPGIRRHFGVSRMCVRRLVSEGVPESHAGLLLNFVDTARFAPRSPLPGRPRQALVFSNYANMHSHLTAVTQACEEAGLELDVVGAGMDRIVTDPERLLPGYDIVFAKGKAAMEAMAVGTAVILCDFSGAGPMVTSEEFDGLRPLNFGFEALREPLASEPLVREIGRYDAENAARVRDLIRSNSDLVSAVEGIVAIYRDTIAEDAPDVVPSRDRRWSVRERLALRLFWRWGSVSAARRKKLEALPGARLVKRAVRPILRRAGL